MQCPNCGKVLVPGAAACPDCGSPIGGEAPVQPPTYFPGAPPAQPPLRAKQATSGWAIASLVLGISGFTCIPIIGSVLAVVFGFLAKSEIKKSSGRLRGSGMATAGIVLGIIVFALIVIAAAVSLPLYFAYVGPERTITKAVELGGAATVNAEIDMTSGSLNVRGGATALMSGDFTYNIDRWKPEFIYDVTGGTGTLTVEQREGWFWPWWPAKNDWDIRFNDAVPLNLKTKLSAGKSVLDLRSLNLTGLNIDSSAGDVQAVLSGTMDSLRRVVAQMSFGHVELDMDGEYGTPIDLNVSNSAGSVDISLLGRWKANLEGTIKASAGSINLDLPRDVGVYVTADTSAGHVNSDGMKSAPGGAYVNDAYGSSPVTLRLDVSASAGNINLKLVD